MEGSTSIISNLLMYLGNIDVNMLVIIEVLGILTISALIVIRTILRRRKNNIRKLNKLVRYNKRRQEIEEEISSLSKQLTQSDISNYLDINNLIFTGQIINHSHMWGDYNVFLREFGLDENTIKVRKNSAAFLTPFNESGTYLYNKCQSILSKMGIFLQRTDNYVDKSDILMNIVSLIVQSELVIVNIDGRNPNVYYELGIAHTLGKPTILLSRKPKSRWDETDIDFDIRQKRIVIYDSMEDLEKKLPLQIHMVLNKE